MLQPWKSKIQFKLRDIFVIILGIAIGYSLNPVTRFLSGQPTVATTNLLTYVVEPPDVLTIQATDTVTDKFPTIAGEHLVGPDGNINLGPIGSVYVAGLTLQQVQTAIEKALGQHMRSPQVSVDVYAYNSKTFYVISQTPGSDTVFEGPITGNDTVLDAVAQIGGVPKNGRLWVQRAAPNGGRSTILPVAWEEISVGASTDTNYQLLPRDRLYIDVRP